MKSFSQSSYLVVSFFLSLAYCESFSQESREIQLILGGVPVKAKVITQNKGVTYNKDVIQKLEEKGLTDYTKVKSSGKKYIAVYKLDAVNNGVKIFDRTIDKYNKNNGQSEDVKSSYIIEYGNTLNILTEDFSLGFKENVSDQQIEDFLANNKLVVVSKNQYFKNQFTVKFKEVSAFDALKKIPMLDSILRFFEPNFIKIQKQKPNETQVNDDQSYIPSRSALPSNPDDSLLNYQWYLANLGLKGKLNSDVKAIDGWKQSTGNSNIIIAILDDGVDSTHPDLKDKIFKAINTFDSTKSPEPSAIESHGTACAGIAAASTNNKIGVSGIAWNCRIMPVKVFGLDTLNRTTTTDDALQAGIMKAVKFGARVLSCSWAIDDLPSTKVNDAIDFAIRNDCILVFAAGNDGIDSLVYPAKLAKTKKIIAVSAVNQWDELKSFQSRDQEKNWASNYGLGLTLVAPGVEMCTTDLTGTGRGYNPDSDYFLHFNGTSSSTPLVAGAIALLLSIDPTLTPEKILILLANNSDHLGDSIKYGNGRLNALRIVSAAISQKNSH